MSEWLPPIWRCEPNHGSGVFAIALDPREAEFVLARGWVTLDEVRYSVSLAGCDGKIDGDGRVMVRCQIADSIMEQVLEIEDTALLRLEHQKDEVKV